MRIALFVAAGLLAFAPVARAEGDGPPLERAEQLEREAKGLLEHGHKVEAAKLMAKAWHLRAEAWAHERGDVAKQKDEQATRTFGEWMRAAKVDELKAKSNALEHEAHEAKQAGREDEAKEKMAASGRLWKEAEELARSTRDAHAKEHEERAAAAKKAWTFAETPKRPSEEPHAMLEHAKALRRQAEELRARSEAFEREAKAARDAGREGEAKEKMRASGRAWTDMREIQRRIEAGAGGDHPFRELRLHRARIQARTEELQRELALIRAGFAPGGDGKLEELQAEIEVLRAKMAALDRRAKGVRAEIGEGPHGRRDDAREHVERTIRVVGPVGDLEAKIERLRAEVRELRELLHALKRELKGRAEAK